MTNRFFYIALLSGLTIIVLLVFNKSRFGPERQLLGTWIGSHAEMDKDVYTPQAYFLHFSKDSLLESYINDSSGSKVAWQWTGSALKIDTNFIRHGEFKLSHNELTFGAAYPRYFARPKEAKMDLSINLIQNALKGKSWKSQEGYFQFMEDGLLHFQISKEDNYQTYCWSIVEFKDLFFLKIEGNDQSCEGFPHFTEQIIELKGDQITTHKWTDGQQQYIDYQLASADELFQKPTDFQKCNPYLYKYNPRHRYYYQGTRYKNGGLYRIRKIFEKQYQVIEEETANGIIKVLFVVNCHGQAGEFEILELDNDYKLKTFPASISSQIMDICRGLQDWVPALNDQSNSYIDSYKYLSFRIKDGQIIDIFP